MFGTMFNIVDASSVIVVLLTLMLGLRRGLARELFPFLSVLINLLVALCLYLPLSNFLIVNTRLSEYTDVARAAAFLAIVLTLGLCLLIIRMVLQLIMKIVFKEGVNRIGGGILGLARGMLVVILIVFGIGLWPNNYLRQLFVTNSFIGQKVFHAVDYLGSRFKVPSCRNSNIFSTVNPEPDNLSNNKFCLIKDR